MRVFISVLMCVLGGCSSLQPRPEEPTLALEHQDVRLGNFSVSLAVQDLDASRRFYESLGFRVLHAPPEQNWLILQNETSTIGLFQGMLERTTLTFNPGWDRNAQPLSNFDDVRDIQRTLVKRGLTLVISADETSTGPAHILLVDPDGNPILIDQHVPARR